MRTVQCQNAAKHSKGRQRPLCSVYIKTRAQSPEIISPPRFKLLYSLKILKYERQAAL